jgi:hypothetical protein
MSNEKPKQLGPASPMLFYGALVFLVIMAGNYVIRSTFKTVKVENGEIVCDGGESLDEGSHIFLRETEIRRIKRTGSLRGEIKESIKTAYSVIKYDFSYFLDFWERHAVCFQTDHDKVFFSETIRQRIQAGVWSRSNKTNLRRLRRRKSIFVKIKQHWFPSWMEIEEGSRVEVELRLDTEKKDGQK